MNPVIEKKLDEIKQICSQLGVKSLYVFGSATGDEFNAESDLDFLISFDENLTIEQYTNNYFELHYRLKDLFGRPVDIVTERSLSNPFFIESVNQSKRMVYQS